VKAAPTRPSNEFAGCYSKSALSRLEARISRRFGIGGIVQHADSRKVREVIAKRSAHAGFPLTPALSPVSHGRGRRAASRGDRVTSGKCVSGVKAPLTPASPVERFAQRFDSGEVHRAPKFASAGWPHVRVNRCASRSA
jgi:hypothetical protein